MRTTVRLDDDLLTAAKRRAVEQGSTLTAVIETALRRELAQAERSDPVPLRLPVVEGRGVKPVVDVSDSAALRDFMDGLR